MFIPCGEAYAKRISMYICICTHNANTFNVQIRRHLHKSPRLLLGSCFFRINWNSINLTEKKIGLKAKVIRREKSAEFHLVIKAESPSWLCPILVMQRSCKTPLAPFLPAIFFSSVQAVCFSCAVIPTAVEFFSALPFSSCDKSLQRTPVSDT